MRDLGLKTGDIIQVRSMHGGGFRQKTTMAEVVSVNGVHVTVRFLDTGRVLEVHQNRIATPQVKK